MSGRGRLALGATAVVLLATVASAAAFLPGRVEVYYTPTDQPDVVYDLWQYLTLVVLVTPVMALAAAWIGSTLHSLVVLFVTDPPAVGTNADKDVGAWVAAWTLLWSAGAVWLVIWLGNEQPVRRSWCELLLVLAGLVGTALIIGGRARHTARRAQGRTKQRARGSR